MTSNKPNLTPICVWCQNEFNVNYEQSSDFIITGCSCKSCTNRIFNSNDLPAIRDSIDKIDAPILVLQPEPRQVYTANKKACELFGKELSEVEGYRGGQVFDCIQSFTELGCGKDANCENCKIKGAIVETFTGNSFAHMESPLEVKKGEKFFNYVLQISTEKAGDLALIRIDKYQPVM